MKKENPLSTNLSEPQVTNSELLFNIYNLNAATF
jgi:hypothetical protein